MRARQANVMAAIRPAGAIMLALMAAAQFCGAAAAAEKHTSPLTTILNTRLYADPGPVPDFVEKSRRPGGSDYIPLRASESKRAAKPKTAAELKAMEMDLDASAAANRRRAGKGEAPAKKSSKVSAVGSGSAAPIH